MQEIDREAIESYRPQPWKGTADFVAQLAVNGLWSPIFFAWHRLGLATLDIGLLWLLILATIAAFRRHDRVAALLLLPYLAWVSFASALTLAIWRLNP